MVNNTPESKLDETVKNTLNNYEAQYDPSDWSRMESMLDAAPKASPFKWSHAITVVIGVVVIGGGYALYHAFSGSETKTELNSTPPASKENIVKESPKTITKPVPAPAPVTTAPTTIIKDEPPATTIAAPEKKTTPTEITVKPETKAPVKYKNKTSKAPEKQTETGPIIESHDKIMGMGNEPVFGDMLDSSRGIVNETKEKEETKKAAKAKKNTPVGWNQFMLPHVNADSLKKYRDQRDSLKNE